jgi:hypothetical protein
MVSSSLLLAAVLRAVCRSEAVVTLKVAAEAKAGSKINTMARVKTSVMLFDCMAPPSFKKRA